ncbi:MAG TPA: S16 family serine protease [Nitrospiraceae bacterium]|nr:S16 family serine protease [Nitrospiraceae bacterium]
MSPATFAESPAGRDPNRPFVSRPSLKHLISSQFVRSAGRFVESEAWSTCRIKENRDRVRNHLRMWTIVLLITIYGLSDASATQQLGRIQRQQEQQIPILGVMVQARGAVGVVAKVAVSFAERTDRSGLAMVFPGAAGKLSPMAQTSIEQAVIRAARIAGLSPHSWSVSISVLHPDVTIYGYSLSAMVALTVIAMAKGDRVLPDCVLTGGISPDGHILTVGGVPLKVEAAGVAHIKRVLVPDESSVADGDWSTPFLMQVSPVASIQQAYLGLTGHPLLSQLSAEVHPAESLPH